MLEKKLASYQSYKNSNKTIIKKVSISIKHGTVKDRQFMKQTHKQALKIMLSFSGNPEMQIQARIHFAHQIPNI